MAFDVLFAAAERGFLQLALQPLDAGQIGGVVGAIGFRVFIDERFYRSHFVKLCASELCKIDSIGVFGDSKQRISACQDYEQSGIFLERYIHSMSSTSITSLNVGFLRA